jgi:hypothetical protein
MWFQSEASAEKFRAGMAQFYDDIRIERLSPEAISQLRKVAPVPHQQGEGSCCEISESSWDKFT